MHHPELFQNINGDFFLPKIILVSY